MKQTGAVGAILLVLSTTTVLAKDITITLNDQEQVAFRQILDLALKSQGTGALQAVILFMQKMTEAAAPAVPTNTPSLPPSVSRPTEPKP